jgi:GNAT superfamily N-acetyltransferase
VKAPIRIRPIEDERSVEMSGALALIEKTFSYSERQNLDELRNEIEEKRLGMHGTYEFHMLAAMDGEEVVGTAAGAYLAGVNCGFITYIAVDPETRGRRVAQRLRTALVKAFRGSAREAGHEDLDFVLGEVRSASPWLKRLVRAGAIPFDLTYYHPGMNPGDDHPAYTLYREPVAGGREPLEPAHVRRIIYAIYRRAYRARFPLQRRGFRAMLNELEAQEQAAAGVTGADPGLPAGSPEPAGRR